MRKRQHFDLEALVATMVGLVDSESNYAAPLKQKTIKALNSLLTNNYVYAYNFNASLPAEIKHPGGEEATPFQKQIYPIWQKIQRGLGEYLQYRLHKEAAIDAIKALITRSDAEPGSEQASRLKDIEDSIHKELNADNQIGRADDERAILEWRADYSFGKKPLHSVWFGPPPTEGSPHFGTDTLAASVYAKALQDDPDAQVNFWCLDDVEPMKITMHSNKEELTWKVSRSEDEKFALFCRLKKEEASQEEIMEELEISRSTYFRYRKRHKGEGSK